MLRCHLSIPALWISACLTACSFPSDTPSAPAETSPVQSLSAPVLRPQSDLSTQCHGWPGRPWTRRNHASVQTFVQAGQPAIDFELSTAEGQRVRLSTLLKDKPVLLHSGSYTCPRFQSSQDGLTRTARKFGDDLHTAVVYVMEAHPGNNQPSAYHGVPKPHEFSDRGQSRDWEARASSARDLTLGTDIIRLIDDLDGKRSNPFWCSYGTCPSCSFLIGQDGQVHAVHLWHDEATMNASIDALLASNSGP